MAREKIYATEEDAKEANRKKAYEAYLKRKDRKDEAKKAADERLAKVLEHQEKRRQYSYDNYLKSRHKGTGRIGRPRGRKIKYKSTFAAWVLPLVGEPILIGPFKKKELVMAQRMKAVEKLASEGNARESDIKVLALYESGYFNDDEE